MPSAGTAFEDYGSDFRPAPQLRIPQRKGKHVAQRGSGGAIVLDHESLGDDELDFLSSRSCSPASRTKPKSTPSLIDAGIKEGKDGVVMNGVFHSYLPEYKPQKLPDFKKKTKQVSDETHSAPQSSQSSTSSIRAAVGQPGTLPLSSRPPRSPSTQARPSTSRATHKYAHAGTQMAKAVSIPSRNASGPRRNPPFNVLNPNRAHPWTPEIADAESEPEQGTPRPSTSQRPRPTPAYKGTITRTHKATVADSDREDVRGRGTVRQSRRRKASPVPLQRDDENSSNKRGQKVKMKGKGKEKEALTPIDLISPLTSQGENDTEDRDLWADTGKGKGTGKDPISALSPLSSQSAQRDAEARRSEDFPLLSPLSSHKVGATPWEDFPVPSPPSSPAVRDSSQAERVKTKSSSQLQKSRVYRRTVMSPAESSSGEADVDLQPFPMQTQLLESIRHSPAKRLEGQNSDLEDAETQRARKKRRADPNEILADILRTDDASEFDEDDMFLLGGDVDPHTICPWCDERLPVAPSPHLQTLVATARAASRPDPRPGNPLGLRAPLSIFISVCQRHRFESIQIPRAQQLGWPTQIEWERVGPRVKELQPQLQEIIDDVDEDFSLGAQRAEGDEDDAEDDGRPRKGSIFWRDAVKNVRKSGSRKAAGVIGQLASFSKTQPGYYGELGYVIMHQIMYDLFSPASFPQDSTLPLTPNDFIQLILIPEAAVSLIMEDMGQTRGDAIDTLRDSAEYGVAMFPDDHTDGMDAVDQGERIIKLRAEARRKELEVEDRIEEKMLNAPQPSGRPKPRRKLRTVIESDRSDLEHIDCARPRKGKGKETADRRGKAASNHAEPGADDVTTTDCKSSLSSMKRASVTDPDVETRMTRSRARNIASSSDIDMGVSDDAQSSAKEIPRPKPRRKRAQIGDERAHIRGGAASQPEAVIEITDSAESDAGLDAEVPQRSSSQSVLEVKWDRKCKPHFSMDGRPVDDNATPRPKKMLSSAAATAPLFPLQTVRDRQAKAKSCSSSDGWSRTMRDGYLSETTTEDEDPAPHDAPARSVRRPREFSSDQRTENYGWLLSDDTPQSSQ